MSKIIKDIEEYPERITPGFPDDVIEIFYRIFHCSNIKKTLTYTPMRASDKEFSAVLYGDKITFKLVEGVIIGTDLCLSESRQKIHSFYIYDGSYHKSIYEEIDTYTNIFFIVRIDSDDEDLIETAVKEVIENYKEVFTLYGVFAKDELDNKTIFEALKNQNLALMVEWVALSNYLMVVLLPGTF